MPSFLAYCSASTRTSPRGQKRLGAGAVGDCTVRAIHASHAACRGVWAARTIGGGVFAALKTAAAGARRRRAAFSRAQSVPWGGGGDCHRVAPRHDACAHGATARALWRLGKDGQALAGILAGERQI